MGRPSPSPHAALLPLLLLAALSCAAASGRPLPKVFKAELEGPGLGISTGTPGARGRAGAAKKHLQCCARARLTRTVAASTTTHAPC